VTVVATGELEDAVTRREGSREPDGAHRRLRPGGDEPDLLDRRHRIHDLSGELDLGHARCAEARAELRGGAYRFDRLAVAVSEEERAPGHDPVEVAVSFDVLDVGTLAAAHEEGLVEADRAHRAHRRVHSAGNELERAAVQLAARSQSQEASSLVQ